jgi:hypothetical protein
MTEIRQHILFPCGDDPGLLISDADDDASIREHLLQVVCDMISIMPAVEQSVGSSIEVLIGEQVDLVLFNMCGKIYFTRITDVWYIREHLVLKETCPCLMHPDMDKHFSCNHRSS